MYSNQSTAKPDLTVNDDMSSENVSAIADIVLSCVIISEVMKVILKYVKQMKILKSIGPSIEPCGIPDLINLNRFRTPFIFTDCL